MNARGVVGGIDGAAAAALKIMFVAVQAIVTWWAVSIHDDVKHLNEKIHQNEGRVMVLEGYENVNKAWLLRIEKKIDDIRDRIPNR